jgi:RNA polymerase sigma-70 factor (ECF subfamily)
LAGSTLPPHAHENPRSFNAVKTVEDLRNLSQHQLNDYLSRAENAYRRFFGRSDSHAANDFAQETLMNVIRHFNNPAVEQPHTSISHYVMGALSNSFRSGLRRNMSSTALSLDVERFDQGEVEEAGHGLMQGETRNQIEDAIDSIRFAGTREVVRRFYLEEKQISEIADELNIPIGTVKRRLHQGREYLRDALEDHNDNEEL